MNVPVNMLLAIGSFLVFVFYIGFALGVLIWLTVVLAIGLVSR